MQLRPVHSLLIANRGEIASRIIRTCRNMGIRSIAVYSEADRNAPYVAQADQALLLGKAPPQDSYLNPQKLIALAQRMQVDAIHPGYGFLAENAAFAQACEAAGILFIGPNAQAIAEMGSKSQAKTLMERVGVPVIPGYQGADQHLHTFSEVAQKIGYPVLLKAAAGGGGKGMRIVGTPEALSDALEASKREAQSAFGESEMILEKYIESGRHIEFQIFGDKHGQVLHLLERGMFHSTQVPKNCRGNPFSYHDTCLNGKDGKCSTCCRESLEL